MSPRDPDVRNRLQARRAEMDSLNATACAREQQLRRGPTRITPAAVGKFGKILHPRLIDGDPRARQRIIQPFLFTGGGLKGWREWHKHLLCCRNVAA
jgi:hypothetical protein